MRESCMEERRCIPEGLLTTTNTHADMYACMHIDRLHRSVTIASSTQLFHISDTDQR